MNIFPQIKTTSPVPMLKASYALVFYQCTSDRHGGIISATKHSVNDKNELGLGTIISPNSIAEEFYALDNDSKDSFISILPPNILIDENKTLMWHTKRRLYPMWFRNSVENVSHYVEWPPLLFIVDKSRNSTGGKMRVFALPSDSRPQSTTRIYNAPLMNISATGSLCLGSAFLPSKLNASTISECEAALFDSQFTHVSHSKTIKGCSCSVKHERFWKELGGSKVDMPRRVRVSDMIYTGLRLSDLIESKNHARI